MAAGKRLTPTQEKLLALVLKPMSRLNTWVYRLSRGRIGGRWTHGEPILLLTSYGRKSGARRTAPLVYLRDGDTLVVVASKGGSATNPAWLLNLQANPECEVEIDGERRHMRARMAGAEDRRTLWPRLVAMNPDFDHYQARTARRIPIVLLTPLGR
jgi:deazaflavin-dependent oxidoreductase (nitroreductase family)